MQPFNTIVAAVDFSETSLLPPGSPVISRGMGAGAYACSMSSRASSRTLGRERTERRCRQVGAAPY